MKVKIAAYSLIILISIGMAEFLSLAIYGSWHLGIRDLNTNEFIGVMRGHLNKIYRSQDITILGDYDPLTQMQFRPNIKVDLYLETNNFGFIGNDSGDTALEQFPNKDRTTYRVIMLGGSSTAGMGVDSNSKTIAAQLERMVNAELKSLESNYIAIQVLNFGHPASNSSIELAKLSQYLVFLDPDLVINFDGFNDAWSSAFEANRVGIDLGIVNWASVSYKYYECLNFSCKGDVSFGVISYALPFSTSLINSFVKIINKNNFQDLVGNYPPYLISKFIDQKGDTLETLSINYSASAGLACSKNFGFLGILQPHAAEVISTLTKSEREKMKRWEQEYGSFTGGLKGYVEGMKSIYDQYEIDIQALNDKFLWCNEAQFLSFRDLFSAIHQEDLYVDNIHYTENGNRHIAERLAPEILQRIAK